MIVEINRTTSFWDVLVRVAAASNGWGGYCYDIHAVIEQFMLKRDTQQILTMTRNKGPGKIRAS